MEDEVESNMKPSSKAMKQGKSLMCSEHIHDVKFHHVSTNLKYCFVRCLCVPEEKTSGDSYTSWVCLYKDSGKVLIAECSCFSG